MSVLHFYISEICEIINAKRISQRSGNAGISVLLTDSRNLTVADGCLFFALKSARNDGHKYIESLYNKGVRHFVVHTIPECMKDKIDVDFLIVTNTLFALQQIAAAHRRRFNIPIAGITGSNGKTIVKEWLAFLLSENKKIVKSPKSYNSQIGVPLSVWEMQPTDEIGIFEAGLSQPDEMERNEKVILPTVGILTNIGSAHDEYFIDHKQKINEKLKLFHNVGTLIYCSDNLDIASEISSNGLFKNVEMFTWGRNPDSTLQLQDYNMNNGCTVINALYKEQTQTIVIPFTDSASIDNAMQCWAFMLWMNYPQPIIEQRMKKLPVIEMRMELKEAINRCTVINDSYSSDYNSLQIAVDFLNRQGHSKKTIILSDILQSGQDDNKLYTDVAQLLKAKNISRVIGIGEIISHQAEKFTMEKIFFPDTATFIRNIPLIDFHDETILLKGARLFAFEKIDKVLQQKTHETVMEINLNALADNLNYYRTKLAPGVQYKGTRSVPATAKMWVE